MTSSKSERSKYPTIHFSRIRPGTWIIIMTCWWPIPFFLVYLFYCPVIEDLSSYLIFSVVFSVSIATGLLMNLLDRLFSFWKKMGPWRKYLIISIAYTVNMAVIYIITGLLHSANILRFFGGDAEGSIGMLFIPSVLGYYILGAVFALAATLDNKSKSRSDIR